MKYLDNIDSSTVAAIDVETVRIAENYHDLSLEYQSAWEYKNKQDGEIPSEDELANLWTKNASLYAEFSKVVAVSVSLLNKDKTKLVCKEIFGVDEYKILTELAAFLDKMPFGYKLLAHAGQFFDYPFLAKRFIINGMEVPFILDVLHLKPWETVALLDSNIIWKMGGTGAGSSLQALCTCLNLPISKVDLVGDQVGKSFFLGEYARIGRYCSLDTVAVFNVLRKLKKESIFDFNQVVYLSETKPTGNITPNTTVTSSTSAAPSPEQAPEFTIDDMFKELPLLEKLVKTGKLTKTEKTKLSKAVEPYKETPEFSKIKAAVLSVLPDFTF